MRLQASDERFTAPIRFKVTLLEAPLSVAVTVAFWFVSIVPAVAVKVAEVEPAATVAEEGVVSSVLLSDTATPTPPAGAGALKVIEQVLLSLIHI